MAKVVACRATDEGGKTWDLVFHTEDVEAVETPRDVHDVSEPGDTAIRRKLGKAHLLLHFREGTRPLWEATEKDGE